MNGHQEHAHALPRSANGEQRRRERQRLIASLSLTAIILIAEVVGGLWSHSLALLSDAGHMLSDLGAQVLSLLALAIAVRPADARRTYGYYRIEILAALANGVALLALAVWICWSALLRLRHGVPTIDVGIMIIIAAIGLMANLGGALLLRGSHSLNLRGAYLHLLSDTLSSVAVLLGGVVMMLVPGWTVIDPVLSIAIGLFVTYSAFRLVREAVDVLLEGVPGGVDLRGVTKALAAIEGVRAIHDLHIWTITSGMYALSAHIVIDDAHLTAPDGILVAAKARLLEDFSIAHTTLQIESCAYEATGNDGLPCEPASR